MEVVVAGVAEVAPLWEARIDAMKRMEVLTPFFDYPYHPQLDLTRKKEKAHRFCLRRLSLPISNPTIFHFVYSYEPGGDDHSRGPWLIP